MFKRFLNEKSFFIFIISSTLFVFLISYFQIELCNNDYSCSNEINAILTPVFIFLLPTTLIALITLFLKKEVFYVWFYFLSVWLILYLLVVFNSNSEGVALTKTT